MYVNILIVVVGEFTTVYGHHVDSRQKDIFVYLLMSFNVCISCLSMFVYLFGRSDFI